MSALYARTTLDKRYSFDEARQRKKHMSLPTESREIARPPADVPLSLRYADRIAEERRAFVTLLQTKAKLPDPMQPVVALMFIAAFVCGPLTGIFTHSAGPGFAAAIFAFFLGYPAGLLLRVAGAKWFRPSPELESLNVRIRQQRTLIKKLMREQRQSGSIDERLTRNCMNLARILTVQVTWGTITSLRMMETTTPWGTLSWDFTPEAGAMFAFVGVLAVAWFMLKKRVGVPHWSIAITALCALSLLGRIRVVFGSSSEDLPLFLIIGMSFGGILDFVTAWFAIAAFKSWRVARISDAWTKKLDQIPGIVRKNRQSRTTPPTVQ